MKIVLRNMLAVLVGLVIFFICDTIISPVLYTVAQIPFLGKIIFFLGTEPTQIIANYSIFITSSTTLFSANYIALPNKRGYKIGMVVLSTLLIPLYYIQARNIYNFYGFTFDLILYILAAIGALAIGYSMAFKNENL